MKAHQFHIPVMGIGYTLDTPVKIAKYGIDSVISIVQDDIIEKARQYYSQKYGIHFTPIEQTEYQYRSKRITSYLNLVKHIVELEFEKLKSDPGERSKYLKLLPNSNQPINNDVTDFHMGSIDVNIMTKLDREGTKGEKGLHEACSALKGYAESDLDSSLVLSAGLNPRLFQYMQEFQDFFPNSEGAPRKKVILKVSDYRSAHVQGKMLAKKGIMVSEFRVESGLNCGGHTFATQGHLLGPILEAFKNHRASLQEDLFKTCNEALAQHAKPLLKNQYIRLTVQGGVGTAAERELLHDSYQVDATGWGSPFLLVPEVTNVDNETLNNLCVANSKAVYNSKVSPLGIRFNTLKDNSAERVRERRLKMGKPGSNCNRKHLALGATAGKKFVCTASREYQRSEIDRLAEVGLTKAEYNARLKQITEKQCLCNGLSISFLEKVGITDKKYGCAVSVCPGPNIAYFNRIYTLQEMVDHIYGKSDLLTIPRTNMFLNELRLYSNYLKEEISDLEKPITDKSKKYFKVFCENLLSGIDYYLQANELPFMQTPGSVKEICLEKQIIKDLYQNLSA